MYYRTLLIHLKEVRGVREKRPSLSPIPLFAYHRDSRMGPLHDGLPILIEDGIAQHDKSLGNAEQVVTRSDG